jgi:hypothetical protein
MKQTLKSFTFLLALFAIAFGCTRIHAQTNDAGGLSFTNTSVFSWTGYQYLGNSGTSSAILGASVDIGSFNAGKLGVLDYGIGTEFTISDGSAAVSHGAIRAELIKNLDSAQVIGFIGEGRDFNKSGYYTEFGCELNYNLFKGKSWFSYIGTGINFRTDGTTLEYLPCVRTGIAF